MNNVTNNTELNIRIDRIILEGIPLTSYQQFQLKESIETALAGMFLKNGIPSGIKEVPLKIKADTIQLQEQKTAPDVLGKQIAVSIYSGLADDYGNKQVHE